MIRTQDNSVFQSFTAGSNTRSETLEDRIVLVDPFRTNSLLLDYFNYYYEDRTAKVAAR